MSKSTARSALRVSENSEPSSEWVDEGGSITLLVHLPGFKREQIKVQITNTGHINISGERPLDGQRWSIFSKQYPLPEHCKAEEIQANFKNEILLVRFYIDQDQVASPPVPTPTVHESPSSSPMERATTELSEKAQERNGKSQKAVTEEEELQRKQKQPEAKKETDRNEQPKAAGNQEKKHETLQDKKRSEEGKQPKATTNQEKKHETLQDKGRSEEGKQPKATGIQEKKHETLQDKEKSEGKQPKATSNQEKKHEALQDKERSEESRSNDKKQGQQMDTALKTDDTSGLAKEQELPESSSFPGSDSKGTEMMEQYSTISLFMGLPPAKKALLVNVAAASLVLLGIGLYLTYK